ncbi:MAG: prepilin-type N-terminal cleavage/methylation domain-containing protein [Desulfuromonadales bacterium]|nr:prepilin-type N-terminal cleavage/methylation domain-containing protein [Desulfuromonadales bacterium]
MRKQITSSQAGFTLVEILIAMTIFAFGMLAVATLQITALTGNSAARGVTEANALAQNKLEELQSIPFDDVNGSAGPETISHYGKAYALSWTVDDDLPVAGLKTIAVTVQWQEKGGAKTTSLRYIRADNPLL